MREKAVRVLDEYRGKLLIEEWGIPVIEEAVAADEEAAAACAGRIGYPVSLKVCSEAVLHKTDQGGVILNIPDVSALKRSARDMHSRFKNVSHKLLVQKMAPKGIELILGARRDPVFGPVVMAGIGGVFTEVFRDTTLEIAPVSVPTALAMCERLRGAALLKGFRGQAPVDLGAVASSIASLSRLIMERGDILDIDVNPLIAHAGGVIAVDALVRLAEAPKTEAVKHPAPRTIDPFFNPKSFALIGASRSYGKGGNVILRNMVKAGFNGFIHPINPSGHDILGMKTYRSVRDIPGVVDLAMIVIPKTAVPAAIEDCAARGVRAIILSTGGYSDIGANGEQEQRVLVKQARDAGIRLMGPNSIGTINPASGLSTSIVGLEPIMRGGVSLIGQSGVFSSGWGRWIADSKPFGLSKVACIGNKGDVGESDLLEYLGEDAETTTIGMYLEGINDGVRFTKAAARACRKKPVVVVKSGRTEAGAQAIASHTGSLAGSDAVFEAVCRRTGMIRAHDSESFFDVLAAFESLPLPRNNRLGILSITGMGCVVTTDACDEYGVDLPALKPATIQRLREVVPNWAPVRNPIDIWSAVEQHGSQKTMSHIATCLLEQADIDALLIIFVLMPESIFDIGEAFGNIIQAHREKPMFVSCYGGTEKEIKHIHEGFKKLGIPSYPTPERAIYAFSRMVEYARFRGFIKHGNK
ncbi:MAG TPA: acetate--CoA ligase family protein [Desulfomonilia bacterium]|nr:acetate--CoA ligase family protein [Desulfomonilia bacterium]